MAKMNKEPYERADAEMLRILDSGEPVEEAYARFYNETTDYIWAEGNDNTQRTFYERILELLENEMLERVMDRAGFYFDDGGDEDEAPKYKKKTE